MKPFIFILALFCSLSAKADVLFEPYMGYAYTTGGETESGETHNGRNEILELDFSAPFIGARIGYNKFGFHIGGDFSLRNSSLSSENNSRKWKDDFSRLDSGIFIGFEFPILLRFFLTYVLHSKLEGGEGRNGDHRWGKNTKFLDPKGISTGISYTGLPFFAINVELKKINWDSYVVGTTKHPFDQDAELSELLVSISLPLNF